MQSDVPGDAGAPARRERRLARMGFAVWPGFLAACVLEALVFSMFDPADAHWLGQGAAPDRQAVYTLSFFAFWFIGIGCSGLALWLAGEGPEKSTNDQ